MCAANNASSSSLVKKTWIDDKRIEFASSLPYTALHTSLPKLDGAAAETNGIDKSSRGTHSTLTSLHFIRASAVFHSSRRAESRLETRAKKRPGSLLWRSTTKLREYRKAENEVGTKKRTRSVDLSFLKERCTERRLSRYFCCERVREMIRARSRGFGKHSVVY